MSYWDTEESKTDKIKVRIIPPNNFTILYVLSLGLYGTWWMYKIWKFFREKNNLDILPAVRAILVIIFMYSLLERIKSFAKESNYPRSYSSLFIFMSFIGFSFYTSILPEPYTIIGIVAGILFLPPLEAFNYAVEQSDIYEAVVEERFNSNQRIILFVGGFFWLLLLQGLFAEI